jgi:hypothetical protein
MVSSDLQMIASGGHGAARRLLTESSSSAKALHRGLMACVQRGAHCPSAYAQMQVHVRAGMCVAVLFGREEDEEGANTVPPEVTVDIVRSMHGIVKGESSFSAVNLASTLGCLSSSEANTDVMVNPPDGGMGILDVFTMMFLQGSDVVGRWENMSFRYNVGQARESCAVVLLNLALSARTASAVARHAGLNLAIAHALGDTENLTKKAEKLLNDIKWGLRMTTSTQDEEQRTPAQAVQHTHVMLSYAWAHQETVLRIRHALGELGYTVWIDVEQMSGSTVDAMARAIDTARVLVYCISEHYKNSQNCRMEAM